MIASVLQSLKVLIMPDLLAGYGEFGAFTLSVSSRTDTRYPHTLGTLRDRHRHEIYT
jgi:hypothetical protein